MMQSKSKLALAVLSALALPGLALAQDAAGKDKSKLKAVLSTVEWELYGKLYPEFVSVSHSGATAGGVSAATLAGSSTVAATKGVNPTNFNALATSNSRVGIRGHKTLGSGLTAMAQLEYKIAHETSGVNLSARNSFLGLEGGFGTVKLGVMDTVYKEIGDTLSFLGVSSGNFVSNSSILSKTGFAKKDVSLSSASSFHLRRANSLQYQSPRFGGAQLHLQYSPDEVKTATTNADLWSTGVSYKNKGLYLALAHEIHNDFFGGSKNTALSNIGTAGAHSRDTGTRATAGYKFGNTRVELNLATIKLSESGGAAGKFESYKKNSYSLGLQQKFGKLTAQASYANSAAGSCTLVGGAACTTNGLEGKQLNLGVSYALPEADLFILYSRLNNGSSAKFDTRENDTTALEPGTDVNQLAVGVNFSF